MISRKGSQGLFPEACILVVCVCDLMVSNSDTAVGHGLAWNRAGERQENKATREKPDIQWKEGDKGPRPVPVLGSVDRTTSHWGALGSDLTPFSFILFIPLHCRSPAM